MKTPPASLLARSLAILLITLFAVSPAWATCGGGGGGGGGGMSGGSGGGSAPEVYPVPWKVRAPKDPPAKGLVLYWFPASTEELKKSSLRMSRTLSLYASQCISMELADGQVPNAQKLVGESKLPVAVIATPDGTPVTKVENKDGKLKVEAVEKVLETEVKTRESALDEQLKDAKAKAAAGEKDAAIQLFQSVLVEKCMFPKKAKDAAKELKKLGVNEVASIADAPDFDSPVFEARKSARIELTMRRGLIAENNARYLDGRKTLPPGARSWTRLIRRRCVTWANSIVITSATGTKRGRPSTRYLTCRLTHFRAPLRCMGWARLRSMKVHS